MSQIAKQFSIFLTNKPGELRKLLLKVKKLNLIAAASFATRDGAIMRIVPQDSGSFKNLMKQNNINFSMQNVLLAEIDNKPGGLASTLTKLQKSHINIEGMYIVGNPSGNSASCVIQAEDVKAAKAAIT